MGRSLLILAVYACTVVTLIEAFPRRNYAHHQRGLEKRLEGLRRFHKLRDEKAEAPAQNAQDKRLENEFSPEVKSILIRLKQEILAEHQERQESSSDDGYESSSSGYESSSEDSSYEDSGSYDGSGSYDYSSSYDDDSSSDDSGSSYETSDYDSGDSDSTEEADDDEDKRGYSSYDDDGDDSDYSDDDDDDDDDDDGDSDYKRGFAALKKERQEKEVFDQMQTLLRELKVLEKEKKKEKQA